MAEDTSMEFDMFEDIRRKLIQTFLRQGHELIEAERIALYVVQGIRGVPRLLMSLTESGPEADAKTLETLFAVLDNAPALHKARNILLHLDESAVQ